jgi:hypothetical protein
MCKTDYDYETTGFADMAEMECECTCGLRSSGWGHRCTDINQ